MSFLEDLIAQASGGRAKLVSGEDLFKTLSGVLPDCGQADCPIHHGADQSEDEDLLTAEDLENMTSAEAEDSGLSAVGAAHNLMMKSASGNAVLIAQNQASLWFHVAKILRNREEVAASRQVDEIIAQGQAPAPEQTDAEVARFETEGAPPVD